jgi:hypothetical protein
MFYTRYVDAAVNQSRADGFDVRVEDVARFSPFVRHHINMLRPVLVPPPRPARRPASAARPGDGRRGVTPVRAAVTAGMVPGVTVVRVTGS